MILLSLPLIDQEPSLFVPVTSQKRQTRFGRPFLGNAVHGYEAEGNGETLLPFKVIKQ